MSLQIAEKKGVFNLNGKINSITSDFFKTYFKFKLKERNNVIVNIDNVNQIDKEGLQTIISLTIEAKDKGKFLTIVGYGCKEIYDHLGQINVA